MQVSGPDPLIQCEPPGWPFANGEAEPQLAVDPTNPKHFVGVWNQAGHGIVAGLSFNGGKSWQEVVIPGLTSCSGGPWPFAADPWVSIAANGDVYVSALGLGADAAGRAILVNKSTDGGLTWAQASLPTTSVIGGQPVVQPNGNVVVPLDNASETSLGFTRSTNGGVSFGSVTTITSITAKVDECFRANFSV